MQRINIYIWDQIIYRVNTKYSVNNLRVFIHTVTSVSIKQVSNLIINSKAFNS